LSNTCQGGRLTHRTKYTNANLAVVLADQLSKAERQENSGHQEEFLAEKSYVEAVGEQKRQLAQELQLLEGKWSKKRIPLS
jgi:hypothetical protein